jgi:hypothetical protein
VSPTIIRRCALLVAVTAVPVLAASPATAEVPEGWSNPEEVGFLGVMLYVAALPIGLALLIALAVYLPALARGERVSPTAQQQDEWFGGTRHGTGELESRDTGKTGGGSGSW